MMMLLQHLYDDVDDVVMVPTPCVDDVDVVVVLIHCVVADMVVVSAPCAVNVDVVEVTTICVDVDEVVSTFLC